MGQAKERSVASPLRREQIVNLKDEYKNKRAIVRLAEKIRERKTTLFTSRLLTVTGLAVMAVVVGCIRHIIEVSA